MGLSLCLAAVLAAAPVKLAVLPFENSTNDPQLDALRRGLADILIADLSVVEALTLVERMRIADAQKELQLQYSKAFDPTSRARLGKMLGATHLVLGSMVSVSTSLQLVVRVVEVKSNDVLVTAKVSGPVADVFTLEDALVKQLVQALKLKLEGGARSGHASVPALVSWAQGVDLADQGSLQDAQSKLAEAVRLAPDFSLARDQYAEVLKRVREAQKKRGSAIDERVKTLTAHLTAQLGRPPLGRALAARIGLANLALLELQRLLDAKKDQASWVAPARRGEVERLERLFVAHASALVNELRAARSAKDVDVGLDEADEELSRKTFDLDIGVWDFATPTSVATDLGQFLGSGWTPYRSDVEQFALRPTAAQRSARGLDEARGWFDLAAKELPHEKAESREPHASRLANARAEMLVLLGRREEAVAQWQGYLDAWPTGEDFQAYTRKLEAVMLLDDAAERDEQRLRACDRALVTASGELASRTWRARGRAGLFALGDALRGCAKKDDAFAQVAWGAPAAELQRVADCEGHEEWRARAAKAGVSLEVCR